MSIDPAAWAGYPDHPPRMGFFTDTSVCIGCKACEVACKEWNAVPEDGLSLSGMSYDNTVGLGASTWRHVAFIEQPVSAVADAAEGLRWLMSSDVCKHCTESACLDVCPTGALFRTEFGTVVVQDDVRSRLASAGEGDPRRQAKGAQVKRDGEVGGGPEARRRRRAEQAMVPDAEFTSYYGRPVIKEPSWEAPDVPGYLFLGGLAGASSVLAAGAQLSGYRELASVAKVSALGAIGLAGVALVHDLGRPGRFVNMLRVFKPSSPMSVGSWLLTAYGPVAGAAAVSEVTGILPKAGTAATLGAGLLGPAIPTYTAALICDTAVPAWHAGYREMPYVLGGQRGGRPRPARDPPGRRRTRP